MPAAGYIFDPHGKVEGHYRNATDALLVAIAELKKEGGGTVWIHRPTCTEPIDNEDCECLPVWLVVEADLAN